MLKEIRGVALSIALSTPALTIAESANQEAQPPQNLKDIATHTLALDILESVESNERGILETLIERGIRPTLDPQELSSLISEQSNSRLKSAHAAIARKLIDSYRAAGWQSHSFCIASPIELFKLHKAESARAMRLMLSDIEGKSTSLHISEAALAELKATLESPEDSAQLSFKYTTGKYGPYVCDIQSSEIAQQENPPANSNARESTTKGLGRPRIDISAGPHSSDLDDYFSGVSDAPRADLLKKKTGNLLRIANGTFHEINCKAEGNRGLIDKFTLNVGEVYMTDPSTSTKFWLRCASESGDYWDTSLE